MKKIVSIVLALLMLISLAACGTTGNNPSGQNNSQTGTQSGNQGSNSTEAPNNNSENSQNTDKGLNGASKDNYTSLLKDYFGFDAKDIEEANFTLTSVRGSYFPNNDVQYMLTLEYENTDLDIAKTYTEKMFELSKTLSSSGSVFACLTDESGLYTMGTEYTDFTAFHDTESNNMAWFYKWNGKDILVNIVASFTVRIQLSYSD